MKIRDFIQRGLARLSSTGPRFSSGGAESSQPLSLNISQRTLITKLRGETSMFSLWTEGCEGIANPAHEAADAPRTAAVTT